jgi:uncharacterized protein YjdB/alpha-tubulin suppressor-like RCC1 family protein
MASLDPSRPTLFERHLSISALKRFAATLVLLGCTGTDTTGPEKPNPPVVASVQVTLPSSRLFVGDSLQAIATVLSSTGSVISGASIVWSSSRQSVATVSPTGKVKAVSVGTAEISGSIDGRSGLATLTVEVVPVATIAVLPGAESVTVGQAIVLAAVLKDGNGNTLSGRPVEWSTSDASKATVTDGVVVAIAPGVIDIIARSEGKSAVAKISIVPAANMAPVAAVSITLPRTAFRVGEKLQAAAIPVDQSGGILPSREIRWTSSNSEVLSVTLGGEVTGVGPGSATLTAEVEGKIGSLPIQVSLVPITSISIDPSTVSVSAGARITLVPIVKDSAGRPLVGRTLQWASKAPTVASVSDGLVTGVLVGSAEITASAEGIEGRAVVTVNTVSTPVASISLAPNNAEMSGGATKEIRATLRDANGNILAGREVTWSSSNPDRATVTGGFVSAAPVDAPVVITATAEGRSATASLDITTFVRMSTGTFFSCGLTANGTAYCWGINGEGQLGDGTTTQRLQPTKVKTDLRFVAIASGAAHTCAIVETGFPYCWGRNTDGQLGSDPAGAFVNIPTPVKNGYAFVSVAAGRSNSCGTTSERELYCWGALMHDSDYSGGPVGGGGGPVRWERRTDPLRIRGGLIAVVAGLDNQFCAVDADDLAYCWTLLRFNYPVSGGVRGPETQISAVAGNHRFTTLRVGYGHACGIVLTGQTYCWGQNDFGQLGDGTTTDRGVPVLVSGGLTFQYLAAGGWIRSVGSQEGLRGGYTCGVTLSGRAYCWGSNANGELGGGTATSPAITSPQQVLGDISFTGLRAGSTHTCGLAVGGAAYCWGSGYGGAIGSGNTTSSPRPTYVFGN